MSSLPTLYFRIRDNGASVFRIDTENRDRRIEMDQVATINTNRGDFKPQTGVNLSKTEVQEIQGWIDARMALLAQRQSGLVADTVEQLNQTAHWAQGKGTDDQVEAVTDALLLAMHDLRSILVRKRADRFNNKD